MSNKEFLREEIKRAWNERVGLNTAHCFDSLSTEAMDLIYKKPVEMINIENKRILDFGCGGAALYLYLKDKIKKYIGLDIAKRSLDFAMKNINQEKCELFLIDPYQIDFTKHKADILFCLSVIQHFPDQVYLDYFLDCLNKSNIKTLILQIRHWEKNRFQMQPYKTTHEINLACWTNADYLQSQLSRYAVKEKTKEIDNQYNYIKFVRRND